MRWAQQMRDCEVIELGDCEVIELGEHDGGNKVRSHAAAVEVQHLQRLQGLE